MHGIEKDLLKEYREKHLAVLKPGSTGIMASFADLKKIRDYSCPADIDICFPYYQGKTGYCWLLSMLQCISLNIWHFREEKIVFNQEPLIFFDKLEKANYFLSLAMKYLDKPIDMADNSYIFNNAMTDKGQWNMACNLIKKYGLIHADLRTDSKNKCTNELNASISYLLRSYAFQMRRIWKKSNSMILVEDTKKMAMQATYDLLSDFYEESDCWLDQYLNRSEGHVPFPFDEYISIYVDNDKPGICYKIKYDGNIIGDTENSFLGVPNDLFDQLIEQQVSLQGFCWCTGDAGKFYVKSKALFDDSAFNLSSLGITDILKDMSRSDVWKCHMGSMSHAMVLLSIHKESGKKYYTVYDSGYALDHGKVSRMSESWFKKFLYQGVVHRSLLPDGLINNIVQKSVAPWTFFGI